MDLKMVFVGRGSVPAESSYRSGCSNRLAQRPPIVHPGRHGGRLGL